MGRTTVWDEGAIRGAVAFMKESGGAAIIEKTMHALDKGAYPKMDVDFVGMPFYSRIENAYAYMKLHAQKVSGKVGCINIDIKGTPCADANASKMNEMLASLPSPFKAEFWGGVADEDGSLSWSKPIVMERINCDIDPGVDHRCKAETIIVEPDSVCLEVGTTKPARSLAHLTMENGLARWPYDYNFITVRIVLDHVKWRVASDEDVRIILSASESRLGNVSK